MVSVRSSLLQPSTAVSLTLSFFLGGSAFCELPVEDDWTTAAGTERRRPGLDSSALGTLALSRSRSQCAAARSKVSLSTAAT